VVFVRAGCVWCLCVVVGVCDVMRVWYVCGVCVFWVCAALCVVCVCGVVFEV
jgi:hypothetical protein